ncbi:MAG: hypothetical protein JRJ45_08840 [Deltaproteobacteria bacterium]|nr:hypothetical protein [Deltaproteobacteria bacterium]
MYIFLVGVSCVGKSTIGNRLAEKIDFLFFDLDEEIEGFFGKSTEQIQNQYISGYSYREEGAKVLKKIIDTNKNDDIVVGLTPKGLHDWYYKLIKKSGATVFELKDTPSNILDRIVFYDEDSNLMEKNLTEDDKRYYLSEIKKDISYYRKFYKRAHYHVDISGLDVEGSVKKLEKLIEEDYGKR